MPQLTPQLTLLWILRDLSQRLIEKAVALFDMAEEATTVEETWRLRGKAEGLDLAHSYLHDLIREMLDSTSQKV